MRCHRASRAGRLAAAGLLASGRACARSSTVTSCSGVSCSAAARSGRSGDTTAARWPSAASAWIVSSHSLRTAGGSRCGVRRLWRRSSRAWGASRSSEAPGAACDANGASTASHWSCSRAGTHATMGMRKSGQAGGTLRALPPRQQGGQTGCSAGPLPASGRACARRSIMVSRVVRPGAGPCRRTWRMAASKTAGVTCQTCARRGNSSR